jgi:hypothetical protein
MIICIGISGCAQRLTHEGALVTIEPDAGMVETCLFKGSVIGKGAFTLEKEQKLEGAMNELKNNAAQLGANTVIIVSRETMFEETVIRGKAYHCQPGLIIKSPD